MFIWESRIITYVTNILVLIGYAMLFNWIQSAKFKSIRNQKLATTYLIAITVLFLILFHVASLNSMIQAGNQEGFGWTYINFQIGTVMFAMLMSRRRPILYCLAVLLLAWYWWIPNAPNWVPFYLISLVLMIGAQNFGPVIKRHLVLYVPFSLIFAAPFLITNVYSLKGINVGWPWQISTSLVISLVLWLVQYAEKRHKQSQDKLLREARVDDLTQLYNFRVFNEDLLNSFTDMQKDHQSYALYTLDIDHFKQINDQYGHLMGNQVLEAVTKKLKEITDHLEYPAEAYRTGGEEFSFVLHDIQKSFERACEISRLVHHELGTLQFVTEQQETFHITISLGQDRSMEEDKNYLDVYRRADKYLYHSKNIGRNAITVRGMTIEPIE